MSLKAGQAVLILQALKDWLQSAQVSLRIYSSFFLCVVLRDLFFTYLSAVYSPPAEYSEVFSTTSQRQMNSWLFSIILNYQQEPNVQLLIQQYIQLPTRAQPTASYSAVANYQLYIRR